MNFVAVALSSCLLFALLTGEQFPEKSAAQPEMAVSAEQMSHQPKLWPNLVLYGASVGCLIAFGWNRYLSQRLRQYRDREAVQPLRHSPQPLPPSEDQYQAVLAAIPDFLVRVGVDGRYRELRVPDRDFALFASAELPGKALTDVLPKDLADQYLYYLDQALRTG